MKIMNDTELLAAGISPGLIALRKRYNDRIINGFCMFQGAKIERAFISNPHSYNKVFLLAVDGSIIEHYISPDKLQK